MSSSFQLASIRVTTYTTYNPQPVMIPARLAVSSARRLYATAAGINVERQSQQDINAAPPLPAAQGWLFIDSVFPIQLSRWECVLTNYCQLCITYS